MSKPGPNYPSWYAKGGKPPATPKGMYGSLPTDEAFGRAGNPEYGKNLTLNLGKSNLKQSCLYHQLVHVLLNSGKAATEQQVLAQSLDLLL